MAPGSLFWLHTRELKAMDKGFQRRSMSVSVSVSTADQLSEGSFGEGGYGEVTILLSHQPFQQELGSDFQINNGRGEDRLKETEWASPQGTAGQSGRQKGDLARA